METKQAVLPLSAPVSTSILLCFGNRHNHITVFDETIFVSSMTLYQQAMFSSIQKHFLRCKMLVGKVPQTPLFCIFQCRLRVPAGHFLSDDTFRVIENLHKVRCSFCQRSILHLFITSDLYEYTFQILQRIDYRSMSRGSTQPLITQGDMSKVSILLPDKKTLLNFESIVGQLMEQYQANLLENDKLSELRDTLLAQTIR